MDNSPLFYLQIVDRAGKVAHLPGGGQLEADLIELVTQSILDRGVRFKSKTHVEQDIRDGLVDALMFLKQQTIALAGKV